MTFPMGGKGALTLCFGLLSFPRLSLIHRDNMDFIAVLFSEAWLLVLSTELSLLASIDFAAFYRSHGRVQKCFFRSLSLLYMYKVTSITKPTSKCGN